MCGTFNPLFDSYGIGKMRAPAGRLQQNDKNGSLCQLSLHDQAPSSLLDISGLGEADAPVGIADQGVGVHEVQLPPSALDRTLPSYKD